MNYDRYKGKEKANATHFAVGKKVRQTIEELGGTMPEDLPSTQRGIACLEKQKSITEKKK